MGSVYLGDKKVTSKGWYLGDAPLFDEEKPIFIDENGKKYYEEDCHVFIANGNRIWIPCVGLAKFVAVNGVSQPLSLTTRTVEVEEIGEDGEPFTTTKELETTAISANDGDIIQAIFDWDNSGSKDQDWYSDILQFGYNSVTGERNQLKNGDHAFYKMEINPDIILTLDISNLTNMAGMFKTSSFNQDISGWDVSGVTNMHHMFYEAIDFNSDLSQWNTSNVTDMSDMFAWTEEFNSDISGWKTSNVKDMGGMFHRAKAFNSELSKWDTSKVERMGGMFSYTNFNQNISGWNTSNVKFMGSMFQANPYFNQDLSKWNTSNVTDMGQMFYSAKAFNSDLSKWNTSKVTGMYLMFCWAESFNSDISEWDTSKVTRMNNMFQDAKVFNQDLSEWCVSQFENKPSSWDSNSGFAWQTHLHPQWGTCPRGENIPNVDDILPEGYVTKDCHVFIANGNVVRLPVPANDPDDCPVVFAAVGGVEVTPTFVNENNEGQNYSSKKRWEVSAGENQTIHAIFDWDNANSLNQDWYSDILQFGLNSDGERNQLKSGKSAFRYMEGNPVAISNLDTSNLTDMGQMFYYASSFNQEIGYWDVSNVENMAGMFQQSSFNSELFRWKTSNVKDMGGMFSDTPFNQNISDWDVSNVENMGSMFKNASSFNSSISNWNVSSLVYMSSMFSGATSFNSDLSRWNISGLDGLMGFRSVFENASSFNSDLSNWDVSTVTEMPSIFAGATSFNGDLSGWDVSNVIMMSSMFQNAASFNQDISDWNTYQVGDMSFMFMDATNFDQDLSEWCVSQRMSFTNFAARSGIENKPEKQPQWGECPRFENTLTDLLDNLGYGQKDCHRFVANTNRIYFPIPNGTTPIFVAVDGEKKDYETDVKGKVFDDSTIHAIFDWDNEPWLSQDWFSDILQFGLNSKTGKRNQLKNGYSAFIYIEANSAAISNLDTSNLTNMEAMFYESVNQDISKWDTSKVEDMGAMFEQAWDFNSDLSQWDTSKVTNMHYMFGNARSFNSDISQWNTKNVTDMGTMFYNAEAFNQDLSQWCVSNVTDYDRFDYGANAWEESKKPVWGTCPPPNIDDILPEGYVTADCHVFVGTAYGVKLPIPNGTTVKFVAVDGVKKEYATEVHERPFNGSIIHAIFDWDNPNGILQNWFSEILQFGLNSATGKRNQLKDGINAFNKMKSNPDMIPTLDTSNLRNMGNMFRDASVFNQDLSEWCVSEIKWEPSFFDAGASAWTLPRPKWGTCPRGEDKP